MPLGAFCCVVNSSFEQGKHFRRCLFKGWKMLGLKPQKVCVFHAGFAASNRSLGLLSRLDAYN